MRENIEKIKYSISVKEEKIEREIRKKATSYRRQDKYRINKLNTTQKKSTKKKKLEKYNRRNYRVRLTK